MPGVLRVLFAAALMFGGAFGCQSDAPPKRARDIDDFATTSEERALLAKFDVAVREPVRRRLRKLLAHPVMGVTSTRTVDLSGRPACPKGWATIYAGKFAVALPPEEIAGSLLSEERLARLELRNGWSLNVFPAAPADQCSGEARRLLAPLLEEGERLFPRGSPLHEGWKLLQRQFEEQLVFDSDLELFERVWRTDLRAIGVDELTTAELAGTWQLAAAKSEIAGAMERVVTVEGAHFAGHTFGDPASSEAICFQGFDAQRSVLVMLTRTPKARGRPIAEDLLWPLIASLRPQESKTPTPDMLARAERLLATGDPGLTAAVVAFLRSAAQYASPPAYRKSILSRIGQLEAETKSNDD